MRSAMTGLLALVVLVAGIVPGTAETFVVHPVGTVVKSDGATVLEILPAYENALLGLDGFSHVIVLYWFDRNDTPEKRSILRVHPRGDERNPITGVFATRSPVRPNLIGLAVCRIKRIQAGKVVVDKIDAFDRTPIIDLKPYIPAGDCPSDVTVPTWVTGNPNQRP